MGLFTISRNALIKRINRKLAQDGQKLCTSRGARARMDLGEHYIVDVYRNFVIDSHVDPEDLGREIGVLERHETIAAD